MIRYAQLKSVGFFGVLACLRKKIYYRHLANRYDFDLWHAKSPFECRGYKREVVELAKSLKPKTVIEIGCGLGEILSRVCDCRRFGFDIDSRVVAAAKELHGDNLTQFTSAALHNIEIIRNFVDDVDVDLLIMVNWPHALLWTEVVSSTIHLAKSLSLKHLIIDTIATGTPGYPYYHSLADLQILGEVIDSKQSIDGVRTLHIISLNVT